MEESEELVIDLREEGDANKDKTPDDPSGEPPDEDTDDQQPVEGAASPPSSRSSTPAPPEEPPMLPKDISSSSSLPPPELMQQQQEEEEDSDHLAEDAPLDFSVKRGASEEDDDSTDDEQPPPPPPTNGVDGPLDLTVRVKAPYSRQHNKHAKVEVAAPLPSSPWDYSAPRHLPKPLWNGKVKSEKKSSKQLNSSSRSPYLQQKNASPPLLNSSSSSIKGKSGKVAADPYRPAGRQNPWQSQWMSRSSEQTRDVFTCVWCKESFRSLEDMTLHMKQSPRCGMAGMQTTLPPSSANPPPPMPQLPKASSAVAPPPTPSSVVKENVSLPRKLVRGQDVWLGKGAEQTRQILKCMWCGQSFKTLADMTTHMRVTQHYTNIISQEQIISWRTPEDKMAAQSQVNAVLTCKVCDQAFGSLKELSYHMVKNSHYKEHILRSITEGGGRRRQTRERRKKSLPVRKLLELERMELSKGGTTPGGGPADVPLKNEVVDGKISCEECTEKVDAKDFVQHIKNCASRSIKSSSSPGEPTTSGGGGGAPSSSPLRATPEEKGEGDTNSLCDSVESAGSTSVLNAIEKLIEKSFESKGRRSAASTGILQRLGIDEEVYPPWHPSSSPSSGGAFGMLAARKSASPRLHDYKMDMADFSGSESRSRSSSTSEKQHGSFDEHLRLSFGLSAARVSTPSSASCSPVHFRAETPEQKEIAQHPSPKTERSSPDPPGKATPPPLPPSAKDDDPPTVEVKTEPRDEEEEMEEPAPPATPKSDRQTPVSARSSSCEPPPSPAAAAPPSPAAKQPRSRKRKNSEVHRKSPAAASGGHSSSKQSRKGTSRRKSGGGGDDGETSPSAATPSSREGDHPLKELQKLLDKTDAHLSRPSPSPGSILAFSWACSEAAAAATTSDSLMKCAFCDTHFISKGAYRHHLSKMHFVKDGSLAEIAAASTWKPPAAPPAKGSSSNGCAPPASPQKDHPATSPAPPQAAADESPHSKFLKYTELAKQLSSKYV